MSASGRVLLVVDDQQMVLATVALRLRRAGYEVLEALSGEEALRVLETRNDVSLVIIDCDMPGMPGAELNRRILQRWPHVRLIATSGRPPAPDLPEEARFLPKPHSGAALLAAVEDALS